MVSVTEKQELQVKLSKTALPRRFYGREVRPKSWKQLRTAIYSVTHRKVWRSTLFEYAAGFLHFWNFPVGSGELRVEGRPLIILGMKPDNSSDSELLQAMRAGDEEALAALYRRRQPGIYRFALQMCGSQQLAEDITQEVFMVLMREAHTFDSARGPLNAFLMGIARHQVLRRLQRERFYVSMNEAPDNVNSTSEALVTTVGPLDEMSRTEAIEAVRRAVLALPERYREVVVLCDLQEMSYGEAAEILGCAIGTVRSRLHRARALLIEKLRPAREEDATSATVKSTRCFA